jgi:hypothetical protein
VFPMPNKFELAAMWLLCVVVMLCAAWTQDGKDSANDGREIEIIRQERSYGE